MKERWKKRYFLRVALKINCLFVLFYSCFLSDNNKKICSIILSFYCVFNVLIFVLEPEEDAKKSLSFSNVFVFCS